MQINFIENS